MLAVQEVLCGEFSFDVEVVDIDTCHEKFEHYDQLIPVLTSNGKEIRHYFLDERCFFDSMEL